MAVGCALGVSKLLWKLLLFLVVLCSACMLLKLYNVHQRISWQWERERHRDVASPSLANPNKDQIFAQMAGPLLPNDTHLLQLVSKKYLVSPSKHPYVLKMDERGYPDSAYATYRTQVFSWPFLNEVITTLFRDEPAGFFVEAGALDGEYLSNTLDLERLHNWTGLLVEADIQLFRIMQKKNRKVWLSHSCLAAHPYAHQTTLVKFTNHLNINTEFTLAVRGFNALLESRDLEERLTEGFPVYENVQCFPLQTLLMAINITHVNLISLDVEGVEMGILKSFWGSPITVDVWIVEHSHSNLLLESKDSMDTNFIYWFQSKGYALFTASFYTPKDYIFIRNGSSIYDKAFSRQWPKFKKVY